MQEAVIRQTNRLNLKASVNLDFEGLEIASDRLTLRPVTQEFAPIMFREFTPEVARYMFPRPPSHIDETRAFISEAIQQRAQRTDIILVILGRETGDFYGVCGLHGRHNPRQPEFGIWLAKSAHGHGYGKEAIRAFRDWSIKIFEIDAFVYPVDKANIPSRKIPESLGGVVFEEKQVSSMSGAILDEVVYRIPARE